MHARTVALRLVTTLSIAALLSTVSAVTSTAHAQGRKPADTKAPAATKSKVPPGHAKKVSASDGVVLSRQLLVKHGFEVVRVEIVNGSQVIYYRAGNQGRGRGHGPVSKMVVRPAGDIVVFDGAPEKVRLDIKIQLGF